MYNVLIRPLSIDDAQISWKWRNDPLIWKYTASRPDIKITSNIERGWIETAINEQHSRRFAIIADDVYIGNVQLTNIENVKGTFHIFIGEKNYWGKGIATLAAYQILFYAKEILGLKFVNLTVDKQNIPAIKSYEKVGFRVVNDSGQMLEMICLLEELEKPMLSVFVMVYNHERFLKACLDGILMQKCDFNFDIVVGEDRSTDNSRKILQEYQQKFPGKFKLLLHPKNIGPNKNQELVFKNCQGKYIAFCEGDDYWTNAQKLQTQVNLLQSNPQLAISFHAVSIIYDQGTEPIYTNVFSAPKEITTITDLAKGNYIQTASCVLRNQLDSYPEYLKLELPAGDWSLFVLTSVKGDIHFDKSVMSVYRVHYGGIHSTKELPYINFLPVLKYLSVELEKMGQTSVAKTLKLKYRRDYVYHLGWKLENNHKNRFRRAYVILTMGTLTTKLFFWFPILFGKKALEFRDGRISKLIQSIKKK